MRLSLIVAMDRNRLIGQGSSLPWRLSSDLKHFREITMGKPIVMGRKTHQTINRPLPGRENIILTRDPAFSARGCTVFTRLDEVLAHCRDADEIMIMGGADLYRQTLDLADRMYLTEVHAECQGDTWFPEFDRSTWTEIRREDFRADAGNEHDFSFVVLEKTGAVG